MFVGCGQIKRLERSEDFLTCFSCCHLLHLLPVSTVWRKQEAQLYKEEGNQRYREGKYQDAVSRYHRILLQLQGLDPSLPSPIPNLGPQGPALTPEQENILHTIQTDCYNNLAACLLQMEPVNYEQVREYSQKVLELIMPRPCIRLG